MKHAVLGASSSRRWLTCPGSVEANRSKDRSASNPHAMLGVVAHALLETCLRLGTEPDKYIDAVLVKKHPPVDEDMADAVGFALDYINSYVANNPGTKVLIEYRVHYGTEIGTTDELAFGTSDVLLCNHPKELVCLDYKHGVGIGVSVKNNSQLQLYLLGRRKQMRKFGRYRRYRAVIVQPRLRGRKPVQEAPVITDKALDDFATEVRKVVPIALGRNAPRKAGDHCRYCAANGNCPEQYKLVLSAAKKEFAK